MIYFLYALPWLILVGGIVLIVRRIRTTPGQPLYKLLQSGGISPNVKFTWQLPKNGKPGPWMPPIKGPLKMCDNGYHFLRMRNLLLWEGTDLYLAEIKGPVLKDPNKMVAREARLVRKMDKFNGKNVRLFAADCAERVLPLFTKHHGTDGRVENAIKCARMFAEGEITKDQLQKARNGAVDAAMSTDGAALRAAQTAAEAARAGNYTAAKQASEMAVEAVKHTNVILAEALEKRWQVKRLAWYVGVDIEPWGIMGEK